MWTVAFIAGGMIRSFSDRISFDRILYLKTRRKRKAKYLADPLSLWRIVLRLESVQLSPGSTLNEIALFLLVLP